MKIRSKYNHVFIYLTWIFSGCVIIGKMSSFDIDYSFVVVFGLLFTFVLICFLFECPKCNHPTTWKDPKGATLYSYAKICPECGTRYWPFYDS